MNLMDKHSRGAIAKTALVAGVAGFIGSHLAEALLRQGTRVIGLDNFRTGMARNISHLLANDAFELINHDVIEPIRDVGHVDVVFNLACAASPLQYQVDPVHTLLTSVMGTRNLLACATECGARFVQASTSEVYGDPLIHPQSEGYFGNVNPVGPRACYDEGKRAAETLCADYARQKMLDVRVARIFNTYGPRMRPDDGRVVSTLAVQAIRGEDLTVFGNGEQTRSFCYVDDLVRGLLALAAVNERPLGPVNLGNPAEITVLELAREVLRLAHSRSRIVMRPLPEDDPKRRRPDIGLAMETLGWSPRVVLRRGLAQTVAWFVIELERLSIEAKREADLVTSVVSGARA